MKTVPTYECIVCQRRIARHYAESDTWVTIWKGGYGYHVCPACLSNDMNDYDFARAYDRVQDAIDAHETARGQIDDQDLVYS